MYRWLRLLSMLRRNASTKSVGKQDVGELVILGQSQSPLFELPAEIRMLIYMHALTLSGRPIHLNFVDEKLQSRACYACNGPLMDKACIASNCSYVEEHRSSSNSVSVERPKYTISFTVPGKLLGLLLTCRLM